MPGRNWRGRGRLGFGFNGRETRPPLDCKVRLGWASSVPKLVAYMSICPGVVAMPGTFIAIELRHATKKRAECPRHKYRGFIKTSAYGRQTLKYTITGDAVCRISTIESVVITANVCVSVLMLNIWNNGLCRESRRYRKPMDRVSTRVWQRVGCLVCPSVY